MKMLTGSGREIAGAGGSLRLLMSIIRVSASGFCIARKRLPHAPPSERRWEYVCTEQVAPILADKDQRHREERRYSQVPVRENLERRQRFGGDKTDGIRLDLLVDGDRNVNLLNRAVFIASDNDSQVALQRTCAPMVSVQQYPVGSARGKDALPCPAYGEIHQMRRPPWLTYTSSQQCWW